MPGVKRRAVLASWIPLALLVLLTAVAAATTEATRASPEAALYRAARAFTTALSAGDVEQAAAYLAPQPEADDAADPEAWLESQIAVHRGATFTLLRVTIDDAGTGRTTLAWVGVDPQMGRTRQLRDELRWARDPSGRWRVQV